MKSPYIGFLTSIALVFFCTAAQAALIESEPNNTLATADTIVLVDSADVGLMSLDSAGGDIDVFAITLDAGDFLFANTTGISEFPPGSSPDTMLGLFDSAGIALEIDDDDGPIVGSSISFPIATDGLYYLAVTGFPDADEVDSIGDLFGDVGTFEGLHTETGSYILTVSVIPVPEPGTLVLLGGLLPFAVRLRR